MLHPHNLLDEFIMGSQREKNYAVGGGFLWDRLWEMKVLNNLELGIKKRCKKLWVRIMPGTKKLWVREFLFHF
jgi:hypothetical protein